MTPLQATLATLVLSLPSPSRVLPTQTGGAVAPDAGCVQHKGSYVCNWSSFRLAFERAHTVRTETARMDRPAAAQLRSLLSDLGKTPVAEGGAADLTMLVMPIESTGVDLGPEDHDIATLRIYAPQAGSPHGVLLWAETLRGQGDRPWPGEVHALLTQFEDRFSRKPSQR